MAVHTLREFVHEDNWSLSPYCETRFQFHLIVPCLTLELEVELLMELDVLKLHGKFE